MTPENPVTPLQAGTGFPIAGRKDGAIGNKAINFYWEVFFQNAEDSQQHRAFSLSFEDDFHDGLDNDFDEDDFDDDHNFLPIKEDDDLLDEGYNFGFRNELYYK